MTHFKVEIQLPLNFNPEKGKKIGEKIPPELFHITYEELLGMVGGINTSNVPIVGSWISPKTKKRYNDSSIIFSVVVESEDKMTITNVPKIKELQAYKEKLKERFNQEERFMIATRCIWI
jgi:hypothetical protein